MAEVYKIKVKKIKYGKKKDTNEQCLNATIKKTTMKER